MVPLAALSRSSGGLAAHWHPWKRLDMADGMAFGPELAYMGMAWQSYWQSALGVAIATLNRRPHGAVPGQFAVDP